MDENLRRTGPGHVTYEEIPKFPYVRGEYTRDVPRPSWAPDDYKKYSFLPTRPTPFDLRNLFNQVHEHFGKLSPFTLPSESKTGGVHSTRYTSTPPAYDEKEETYYIVRLRTSERKKHSGIERVVIELLFRDSDNYLVAWRLVSKAADYKTAYWCLFTDSRTLSRQALFKNKCRHMHYTNSYLEHLEKVKIYDGFLHDAESFLRKLYANPEAEPTYDGYRIFQTLFVMFGEGPRFGPVDTLTFQSIFKAIAFVAAIGNGRLFNLIKSWRNLSYTTLVLKLVLLEEAIVKERERVLDGKLGNRQYCRLVEEVKKHRELLAKRFDSMFANAKELNTYPALRCEARRVPVQVDHLLGPFSIAIDAPSVRGQITLQQLTDKFLYLLKFEDQLVPGILARTDGFYDVLNLTTLSG